MKLHFRPKGYGKSPHHLLVYLFHCDQSYRGGVFNPTLVNKYPPFERDRVKTAYELTCDITYEERMMSHMQQ